MTMESTSVKQTATVIEMTGAAAGALHDPEQVVLQDIDWRVDAGDYWVVAGMHGSGKSDFMAMTGGLIPPQSGSYRLFGQPMPIYDDELLPERLRMGLVFEGGQLFHGLTVAENLALPLQYHRHVNRDETAERVAAMLEWTGLDAWAGVMSGVLGRNWQKRVGLARALILEPELLLLDNPLGGLDLRHTQWWLDFLKQLSAGCEPLKGRRMTLAVTAEDLRPWRERASHFAILQEGRFVALGGRPALMGHREPLVRELLVEQFLEQQK
jgi:phospholipid/cholesterol/gamma-HCH transport system ATP-binding protein